MVSVVPESIIAASAVIAIISMFLPWWCVNGNYTQSINGFNGWGLLYFVGWFVVAAFLCIRACGPAVVRTNRFPFADWFIYVVGGVLMVIAALSIWDSLLIYSADQSNLRYGWWIALVAAILTVLGGMLKQRETPSVDHSTPNRLQVFAP